MGRYCIVRVRELGGGSCVTHATWLHGVSGDAVPALQQPVDTPTNAAGAVRGVGQLLHVLVQVHGIRCSPRA